MKTLPLAGDLLSVKTVGDGYFILDKPTKLVACFKLSGGGNPWIEETGGILQRLGHLERVLQQLRVGEEAQLIVKKVPTDGKDLIEYFNSKVSPDAPAEFRGRYKDYFPEWMKYWIEDYSLCRYESYLMFSIHQSELPLIDKFIRRKQKVEDDNLNVDMILNRARTWALGLNSLGLSAGFLEKAAIEKFLVEELNLTYNPKTVQSILSSKSISVTGPDSEVDVKRLARSPIIFYDDHFKVGNVFGKTLYFEEFPDANISPMFLSMFFTQPHNFKITLYYRGVDQAEAKRTIETRTKGDQGTMIKGNLVNQDSRVQLEHREQVLKSFSEGRTKFIKFSLYLTIYGSTAKQLTEQTDTFLGRIGFFHRFTGWFHQKELFQSTLPQCYNLANCEYLMSTQDVSNAWPWFFDALTTGGGVPIGMNVNREIVPFDPWANDFENWNTVVIGKAGKGKSFFIQQKVIRHLPFGVRVMVIDKSQSYKFLCEAAGGIYVYVDLDSEHHLNVFDTDLEELEKRNGDVPAEKASDIMGFLNVLLSEENEKRLNNLVTSHLDEAIKKTYLRKFKANPKEPIPILSDLKETLKEFSEDQNRPEEFRMLCRRYDKILEPYTGEGSFANLTDRKTTFAEDNPFIVFDTSQLPDSENLLSLGVYIISQFSIKKAKENKKKGLRSWLLLDETWFLARFPAGVTFLLNLAKRSRHLALASTFATQQVGDFLKNPDVQPVIDNATCKFIFGPGDKEAELLTDLLKLSSTESQAVRNLHQVRGVYSQCFAVMGQRSRGVVYICPDQVSYALATTHPDETFARGKFIDKFLAEGKGDPKDKDYKVTQIWSGIFQWIAQGMKGK
jgi:hypothetical protein